jgi:hypothetical protein
VCIQKGNSEDAKNIKTVTINHTQSMSEMCKDARIFGRTVKSNNKSVEFYLNSREYWWRTSEKAPPIKERETLERLQVRKKILTDGPPQPERPLIEPSR